MQALAQAAAITTVNIARQLRDEIEDSDHEDDEEGQQDCDEEESEEDQRPTFNENGLSTRVLTPNQSKLKADAEDKTKVKAAPVPCNFSTHT